MFNKILLLIVIFIVLAIAGISVSPMSDGFYHNLPDGSCVSSVVKILPCSKDSFYFYVLIVLFLLTTNCLLLFVVNSLMRSLFSRAYGRFFAHHSFFYKIKANRWLALLENSPSFN